MTINRIIETIPFRYKDKGFKEFEAEGILLEKKNTCIDFALGKLEKKSLILCGNVGSGKTHLSIAIAKNYLDKNKPFFEHQNPEYKIKIIDADEYFLQLNDLANTGKSKINYINNLLDYDLIILDDLGIANFTPAKQENLYFLVNKCYQQNHALIITTNFTLEQLEQIDARIPSRLNEMATILSFNFNDFRTHKTTIKEK